MSFLIGLLLGAALFGGVAVTPAEIEPAPAWVIILAAALSIPMEVVKGWSFFGPLRSAWEASRAAERECAAVQIAAQRHLAEKK